ncbi:BTAD domain-containing putative transcriptional regulator [Kitasatospora sp. LaBMicrA B282]|uniref:AfsR/SARP family transcriptional regulator n=1 Tax=Kitasatospora sp. LaBMicrA B282 TaxID=3420949 RepID=UPI003D0B8901
MQVLLLGPIALCDPHGTAVETGGPKRRAVLAALALEANRPLSVARLLDLVWDGEPPPQARAALHGHIAALRKVLPAGLDLETVPSGYRLQCAADLVDSHRFERLYRQAQGSTDPAERSLLLQQALGLWRGSAMADLPGGTYFRETSGWLYARRLAVLEAWADCELARGQGARVVPGLEAAVRADGLRQGLIAALMRCLAQAGRQAEALETHRAATARLRDELGSRPGPVLQGALAEVLSGELLARVADPGHPLGTPATAPAPVPVPPAASYRAASYPAASARTASPAADRAGTLPPAPAARPALPPAPGTPVPPALPVTPAPPARAARLPRPVRLVGRAAETAWLDEITLPRPGEVPLAVVVGPAGVGKSALAVAWAHGVADRFPDGRLFADLRGFDEEDPQDPQDVLVGFLLALGAAPEEVPAAAEARAELYDRLSHGRRLLLVLDNARSAEDIRPLLPAGEGSAVLATSRAALLDLVAQDGAAWQALAPLPAGAATELLAATVGAHRVAAEPAAARRLAELCDHLPLALRICGSRLAVRPGWTLGQLVAEIEDEQPGLAGLDSHGAVGIHSALTLTYRQLPPHSSRLLALLGLYPGVEITPGLAAALLGADLGQARAALGSLAVYHLIAEEWPGRYTCPGLVRRYARDLLAEHTTPGERHAALGRLLDYALSASAAALQPHQVYPWRTEWPEGGLLPGVREWNSAAEAQQWFEQNEPTLRHLILDVGPAGFHRHAWRLSENLHNFYVRRDPHGHWPEVAAAGLRAAQACADQAAIGRLESQVGLALAASGQPAQGLARVERALTVAAAAGDLRDLCVGQVRRAVCFAALRRSPVQIRTCWEAALGLARATGERRVEAAVLQQCAQAALDCGDPQEAVRFAAEGLRLDDVYSQEVRLWLLLVQARARHALGRADQALAPARAVLAECAQLADGTLVHQELLVHQARTLVTDLTGE